MLQNDFAASELHPKMHGHRAFWGVMQLIKWVVCSTAQNPQRILGHDVAQNALQLPAFADPATHAKKIQ